MSLRDELEAIQQDRMPSCSVWPALQAFGDDLTELLQDHTVSGSGIADLLRRKGYKVSDQTLTRHRRGSCACPQS